MREVASRSLLNRCGKNIAASAEERAFTFWAQRNIFNEASNLYATRPSREPVVRNRDRNRGLFLCFRVVHVKLAVELVHNVTVTIGARPSDVPGRMSGSRGSLAARDIVSIEVEVAFAIGVEIDGVSDPHRIAARPR